MLDTRFLSSPIPSPLVSSWPTSPGCNPGHDFISQMMSWEIRSPQSPLFLRLFLPSPPLPPPKCPPHLPLSHSEEPDPFLTYTPPLHRPPLCQTKVSEVITSVTSSSLSSSLLSPVVHLADGATFHTFSDVDFSPDSLASHTSHVHTGFYKRNVHFSQYSRVCCLIHVFTSPSSLLPLFSSACISPVHHDSTLCSFYNCK